MMRRDSAERSQRRIAKRRRSAAPAAAPEPARAHAPAPAPALAGASAPAPAGVSELYDGAQRKRAALAVKVAAVKVATERETCPITQEPMEEPVCTIYGHKYEGWALLEWLSRSQTCPVTRLPLTEGDICWLLPSAPYAWTCGLCGSKCGSKCGFAVMDMVCSGRGDETSPIVVE